MNTTTPTKPTVEKTLPKRNPKTGRFVKSAAKVANATKPAAEKAKRV